MLSNLHFDSQESNAHIFISMELSLVCHHNLSFRDSPSLFTTSRFCHKAIQEEMEVPEFVEIDKDDRNVGVF